MSPGKRVVGRWLTIAGAVFSTAGAASADVATFESFPEGMFAASFTDGGIFFSNLDQRQGGQGLPGSFVIENAANILWQQPGFTSPNTLGFGAYSPGAPATFGRLGSFDITPARPAARLTLHLYVYGRFTGRTADLSVTMSGVRVDALSIPMVDSEGLHHYVLDYTGPAFDGAHLSIGPTGADFIFALVDTVSVEDAPPPPCVADWDHSGTVDSADFFAFLNDFFTRGADANADGVTNSQDFFAFLQHFFAGC